MTEPTTYTSDRVFDGIREMDPEESEKHIGRIASALARENAELKKQLQQSKIAMSCLAASRDRWRMEARGKITPMWRALIDGAKPIKG